VWWRSLHQQATVLRLGAPTIAGSMLATLLLAFVSFSLAYGYLMAVRMRVGRLEDRSAVPVSSLSAPRARRPRPAADVPAPVPADTPSPVPAGIPAPAPDDVPTSVASDSHA